MASVFYFKSIVVAIEVRPERKKKTRRRRRREVIRHHCNTEKGVICFCKALGVRLCLFSFAFKGGRRLLRNI